MAVNLKKLPKINLSKGQVVCLTKDGHGSSAGLTRVFFGASWKSNRSIDLDASLICYDSGANMLETIYYGHKDAANGSIHHSGDDLHGGATDLADNETISINLNKIHPNVKYIVATLNSYSGESFDKIKEVSSRIYTGSVGDPDEVLCGYTINNNSTFKGKTNVILGYFYRVGTGWKFRADGTTSRDIRVNTIVNGVAKEVIMKDIHGDVAETPAVSTTTTTTPVPDAHVSIKVKKSLWEKILDFFHL